MKLNNCPDILRGPLFLFLMTVQQQWYRVWSYQPRIHMIAQQASIFLTDYGMVKSLAITLGMVPS